MVVGCRWLFVVVVVVPKVWVSSFCTKKNPIKSRTWEKLLRCCGSLRGISMVLRANQY